MFKHNRYVSKGGIKWSPLNSSRNHLSKKTFQCPTYPHDNKSGGLVAFFSSCEVQHTLYIHASI